MALKDWSLTALLNGSQPFINWREGMLPKDVNNSARQMMADLAPLAKSTGTAFIGRGAGTLEDALAAIEANATSVQNTITSGRRIYSTYASAVSDAATPVLYAAVTLGQIAEVPLTDGGTHTDPVVGGVVANSGIFRWSTSPAGWRRIADVDAVAAQTAAATATAAASAATSAANSIPIPADDNQIKLIKPYISRFTASGSISLDGNDHYMASGAGGTVTFRVPLTATQIAAGKVWVDIGGTLTAPTVQQRTNSAAIGSAVAIPAVGGRHQILITLDPTATIVEVFSGTVTAGNYATGASVTAGLPVDVPAGGDYYAAFGFAARNMDGKAVLNTAPYQVLVITGTVGVINADGTITIPPNSTCGIYYSPKALTNPPATNPYRAMVEVLSGPMAPFTLPTLNAIDGEGSNPSGAQPIYKTLGSQRIWVSDVLDLSGDVDHVFSSAVFSVASGATPLTVRCSLFFGSLPALPSVPESVKTAIADAITAAPQDALSSTDLVTIDTQGDGERIIRARGDDFMVEQASSELMLSMIRLAAGKSVDAVKGSNSNSGSNAAPLATLAAAYAALPAGGTIGLRNGQIHRFDATNSGVGMFLWELVGYGQADTPAIIDFRQHLTGAWIPTGDGGYSKVVTHRRVTAGNSSGSARTVYKLFRDTEAQTWFYDGANIAANRAAAKAAGNAFEVHQNASIVADPWADTPGTVYVYTWYPAVDVDPQTIDMSIQDIDYFGLANCSNIATFGIADKDHTHTDTSPRTLLTDYPLPVLHNKTSIDVNIHGHVGPCCTTGRFKATGKNRPARTGGLELFPGGHPNQDTTHDIIESDDAGYAIYCHGVPAPVNTYSTFFFKSLQVKRLEGKRNETALEFSLSGTGVQAAVAEEIRIKEVYLLDHRGPVCHSEAVGGTFFDSGYVEYATPNANTAMVVPTNTDVTLGFKVKVGSGQRVYIANSTEPGYVFFGSSFEDLSDPRDGIRIFSNGALNKHRIILLPGAKMWDLEPARFGYMPTQLSIGAGCRAGWGGRTRLAIRDYFQSQGVECYVDDTATIVDQRGVIIDPPIV